MIWSLAFLKGLGERAIKTFAQSLAAVAFVGASGNTLGLTDIHWLTVLSIAAVTTLASVLTSIGSANFVAGAPAPVGLPPVTAPVIVAVPPVAADPTPVS